MKSFVFHGRAILTIFKQFAQGRFFLFFLPGLVLTGVFYFIQYQLSLSQDSVTIDAVDIGWIDWILLKWNSATSWIFNLAGIIIFQVYVFAVLTLLSPFNTQLSEQLDTRLTGAKFDHSWIRFFNDFFRMLFVVTLALFSELAFLMIYWLLSWIIGSEIIDQIMYFLIAAFFFGFSFYDFPLERYGKGIFDTFTYAFSKPLHTLLTGSIFLLIYKIPYIGVPLSPVLATMIATIVYLYDNGNIPSKDSEKTINE